LSTALNHTPEVMPTLLKEIPEDVKARKHKPIIQQ